MTLYGKDCQHCRSDPQWREHHESLEGLHQWRCHHCYRKKPWKPPNLKQSIPAGENFVQMLCTTSQDLWKTLWQKDGGGGGEWEWRILRRGSYRNLRATRHNTRGTNERAWWMRALPSWCQMMKKKKIQKEKSSARKQSDVTHSGKRALLIQWPLTSFMTWICLSHGHQN